MSKKKDKLDSLLGEYYKSVKKDDKQYRRDSMLISEPSLDYCFRSPVKEMFEKTPKKECPTIEELAGYLEGTLTDQKTREIKEHLKQCVDCSTAYNDAKIITEEQGTNKNSNLPDIITSSLSKIKRTLQDKKNK